MGLAHYLCVLTASCMFLKHMYLSICCRFTNKNLFKERQAGRKESGGLRKVIETSILFSQGQKVVALQLFSQWFVSVGLVVSDLLVLPEEPEICILM